MFACTGRGGSAKCDLFDDDGKRRCGRCKRAHDLEKVEEGKPKTKGLNHYSCIGATCPIADFNPETCEYYDNKYIGLDQDGWKIINNKINFLHSSRGHLRFIYSY